MQETTISMSDLNDTMTMSMPSESFVPPVALHWILRYNCNSNSDLASISNVNRAWRKITLIYLKDLFKAVIEQGQQGETEGQEELKLPSINMSSPHSQSILNLLLPDMAIEIAKRRSVSADFNSTRNFLARESSAFCIAWFHPGGIKLRSLDLSQNPEEERQHEYSNSGAGNFDLASSLKRLNQATHRLRTKSKSKMKAKSRISNIQTVLDEWQGYRNATDVLKPFGYAYTFVNDVLQYAEEFSFEKTKISDHYRALSDKMNLMLAGVESVSKPRQTTYAVRGATFARPHGFCLCWDDDEKSNKKDFQNQLKACKNSEEQMMLMHEMRVIERRERKKEIRMRDSLPRVVKSTLTKNPDIQLPFGRLEGKTQRCVQFLNAEKDRAVYMRTHPFDCGPLSCPITVFLVGIATEDGCFVSGLRKRFEVGHMYGNGSSDSLVEMSPVCMAVESSRKINNYNSGSSDNNSEALRGSFGGSNHSSILIDGDSDDSSAFDETQDEEAFGDLNCKCKIQWRKKYDNDSYDEDEDYESVHSGVKEEQIVRGMLGPGRWHVYTAIFDGINSTIRIDGVDEPMESQKTFQDGAPVLDGITLGSDHLFDMSLCYGEGSDGEGAGSIAELAYFKGVMHQQDISCFENYLMEKHGIVNGENLSEIDSKFDKNSAKEAPMPGTSTVKVGNQWQQDQWSRDVHSLMMHSPPFATPSGGSVPLRVAARHRSVAWYRCCEVTGKPIRISRIGSKLSTGESSDL